MARSYEPAQKIDAEIFDRIDEVIEKWRSELAEAEVKIDVMFAYPSIDENGEETAPAIVVHGVPAAACIRICNVKERAKGYGDAEMLVDHAIWATLENAQRLALMDHELMHLAIVRDDEGRLRYNDDSRPKLKKVEHDFEFGWFKAVAARHGAASFECHQAQKFFARPMLRQLFLPDFHEALAFMGGVEPLDAPVDPGEPRQSEINLGRRDEATESTAANVMRVTLSDNPSRAALQTLANQQGNTIEFTLSGGEKHTFAPQAK